MSIIDFTDIDSIPNIDKFYQHLNDTKRTFTTEEAIAVYFQKYMLDNEKIEVKLHTAKCVVTKMIAQNILRQNPTKQFWFCKIVLNRHKGIDFTQDINAWEENKDLEAEKLLYERLDRLDELWDERIKEGGPELEAIKARYNSEFNPVWKVKREVNPVSIIPQHLLDYNNNI